MEDYRQRAIEKYAEMIAFMKEQKRLLETGSIKTRAGTEYDTAASIAIWDERTSWPLQRQLC